MPRLRNKLVDDAVEILLDEHVIVPVENNAHAVINQHLMNGFSPTGTMLGEFVLPRNTFAAPFPERSRLFTATLIAITAAYQMM